MLEDNLVWLVGSAFTMVGFGSTGSLVGYIPFVSVLCSRKFDKIVLAEALRVT